MRDSRLQQACTLSQFTVAQWTFAGSAMAPSCRWVGLGRRKRSPRPCCSWLHRFESHDRPGAGRRRRKHCAVNCSVRQFLRCAASTHVLLPCKTALRLFRQHRLSMEDEALEHRLSRDGIPQELDGDQADRRDGNLSLASPSMAFDGGPLRAFAGTEIPISGCR